MSARTRLDMKHYGHADAAEIRELLLDVHDEVYEGVDDPLAGREEFAKFVDHWSAREASRASSATTGASRSATTGASRSATRTAPRSARSPRGG